MLLIIFRANELIGTIIILLNIGIYNINSKKNFQNY